MMPQEDPRLGSLKSMMLELRVIASLPTSCLCYRGVASKSIIPL